MDFNTAFNNCNSPPSTSPCIQMAGLSNNSLGQVTDELAPISSYSDTPHTDVRLDSNAIKSQNSMAGSTGRFSSTSPSKQIPLMTFGNSESQFHGSPLRQHNIPLPLGQRLPHIQVFQDAPRVSSPIPYAVRFHPRASTRMVYSSGMYQPVNTMNRQGAFRITNPILGVNKQKKVTTESQTPASPVNDFGPTNQQQCPPSPDKRVLSGFLQTLRPPLSPIQEKFSPLNTLATSSNHPFQQGMNLQGMRFQEKIQQNEIYIQDLKKQTHLGGSYLSTLPNAFSTNAGSQGYMPGGATFCKPNSKTRTRYPDCTGSFQEMVSHHKSPLSSTEEESIIHDDNPKKRRKKQEPEGHNSAVFPSVETRDISTYDECSQPSQEAPVKWILHNLKTLQDVKPKLEELSKHPLLAKIKPRQPQVGDDNVKASTNKKSDSKLGLVKCFKKDDPCKTKRSKQSSKRTHGQTNKRNRKKTPTKDMSIPIAALDNAIKPAKNSHGETDHKPIQEIAGTRIGKKDFLLISNDVHGPVQNGVIGKTCAVTNDSPTQYTEQKDSPSKHIDAYEYERASFMKDDIQNTATRSPEQKCTIAPKPISVETKSVEINKCFADVKSTSKVNEDVAFQSPKAVAKTPSVLLTRLQGISVDKPVKLVDTKNVDTAVVVKSKSKRERKNKSKLNLKESSTDDLVPETVCDSAPLQTLNTELPEVDNAHCEEHKGKYKDGDQEKSDQLKGPRKCINHIVNILHTKGGVDQTNHGVLVETRTAKGDAHIETESTDLGGVGKGNRRKKRPKLIVKIGTKKSRENTNKNNGILGTVGTKDYLDNGGNVNDRGHEVASSNPGNLNNAAEKIESQLKSATFVENVGEAQVSFLGGNKDDRIAASFELQEVIRINKKIADQDMETKGFIQLSEPSEVIQIGRKESPGKTVRDNLTDMKPQPFRISHPLPLVLKPDGKLSTVPLPLTPEIYQLLIQAKAKGPSGQDLVPSYSSLRHMQDVRTKPATVKELLQMNAAFKTNYENSQDVIIAEEEGSDSQDGRHTPMNTLDHSYTRSQPNTPGKQDKESKDVTANIQCRRKEVQALLDKKQKIEAEIWQHSKVQLISNLVSQNGETTESSPSETQSSCTDVSNVSNPDDSSAQNKECTITSDKTKYPSSHSEMSRSMLKSSSPSKQVPFAVRYGNKMYVLTTAPKSGSRSSPSSNTVKSPRQMSTPKSKKCIEDENQVKAHQLSKVISKSGQKRERKEKARKLRNIFPKDHSRLQKFVNTLGLTSKHENVSSEAVCTNEGQILAETSKEPKVLHVSEFKKEEDSVTGLCSERIRKKTNASVPHRNNLVNRLSKMKHHGDVSRFLGVDGPGNCLIQHQNCRDVCDHQTKKCAKVIQVFKHSDLECRFYMHYITINFKCSSNNFVERWFPFSDFPCQLHMKDYDELVEIETLSLHTGFYIVPDVKREALMYKPTTKHMVFSHLAPYPPNILNLPDDTFALAIGEFKETIDVDDVELDRKSKCLTPTIGMSKVLKLVLPEENFKDVPCVNQNRSQAISVHDTSPKVHSPKFYQPTLYDYFTPKKPVEPPRSAEGSRYGNETDGFDFAGFDDIAYLMKSERKMKISYDRRCAL